MFEIVLKTIISIRVMQVLNTFVNYNEIELQCSATSCCQMVHSAKIKESLLLTKSLLFTISKHFSCFDYYIFRSLSKYCPSFYRYPLHIPDIILTPSNFTRFLRHSFLFVKINYFRMDMSNEMQFSRNR